VILEALNPIAIVEQGVDGLFLLAVADKARNFLGQSFWLLPCIDVGKGQSGDGGNDGRGARDSAHARAPLRVGAGKGGVLGKPGGPLDDVGSLLTM